ncbi:MAG: flagellar protein FlaG [Gallionella sp.]|jgi:flagellar protein FlaG
MLIQNFNSAVQLSQPARNISEGTSVAEKPAVQTPDAAPQVAAQPISVAHLQTAVQNANQAMKESNRDLSFSVDTATKQTVVKLMDSKTGDVIGQFPSHQMLEISKAIGLMQEQLQATQLTKAPLQSPQGLLIRQQA